MDLLIFKEGKRFGVKCKRVDAPRLTRSIQIALTDLELDQVFVIYPGLTRFRLSERVEAVPMETLSDATDWRAVF